jgi:hypothetical protein
MSIASLLRRATAVASAVLLFSLPGCVKANETTTISKDGSGTAKMVMTIDLAKIEAMKEMMKGMGGGEGMEEDPMDEMNAEKVKKRLTDKPGIKIIKVETVKDDAAKKVTHTIELAFESLEALHKSGAIQGVTVSLEKLDDGSYVLTRSMVGDGGMPEGPEAEQMAEAMMPMFEPFAGDLEMATTITLPGAVLETNGTKGEGNAVTWKLGFKDIAKADKRTYKVKFSGEGLSLKPFKVTLEDLAAAKAEEEEPAETGGMR